MIIEHLARKPLATVLRERVFGALSLHSTALEPAELLTAELANAWDDIDDDGQLDNLSPFPRTSTYSSAYAAGAIISSASDLAKWTKTLYGGTFLTQNSRNQMMTPVTLSPEIGYGLGSFQLFADGQEFWGHGGENAGFTSVAFYFPRHDVSIVLLVNQYVDDPLSIYTPLLLAMLEKAK